MNQDYDIFYCSICNNIRYKVYGSNNVYCYNDKREFHLISDENIIDISDNIIHESSRCNMCNKIDNVKFRSNCEFICCIDCIKLHITRMVKANGLRYKKLEYDNVPCINCNNVSCIRSDLVKGLIHKTVYNDALNHKIFDHIICRNFDCCNVTFEDESIYGICLYCDTPRIRHISHKWLYL